MARRPSAVEFGKVAKAMEVAAELHRGQLRKGTQIPYIAHLLAVAALVLEAGGSEDEVVAALLHDAAEDAGGEATLARIREQFGAEVADIVASCSDTFETPKPPWPARKKAYLKHLRDERTEESALRVSLADKLHNARAILADYRQVGDQLWERFANTSATDQLAYYRSLADVFTERLPGPAANELDRTVTELEYVVAIGLGGAGVHQPLAWTEQGEVWTATGRTGTSWMISTSGGGRYGITVADWDRPDWYADTLDDAKQLADEIDLRPPFPRELGITEPDIPDW
jgi:5'-deoxynucleotidase YfbR-like HD superfamily hydrolase